MAAKKTPKKFRQARKAAKVDAKKAFSGAKKASLKDPFTKFSKDDIEVLKEMKAEAKKGYITDDKGNKISVKPTETAQERMARDRAAAKAEALRKYPYDKAELEAMSKADRQAAELEQKRMSEPKSQKAGKSAPKVTEAGKVRSAVTVNEPKPQGYKVDKDGNKIKKPKIINKSTPTKGGRVVQTSKKVKPEVKKLPVAKKGFAAGKELNAEGKAIYDKLVKEGVKPKSALNKALFRQEKGAKVAAKAAGSIATAAKSAATAVKKQGPVKSGVPAKDSMLRKNLGISTNKWAGMTQAEKQSAVKKSVSSSKPIKVPSTVVSSKPNVPGKELAVRPKAGPVVATKAASSSAKKKFTAKGAALGAAKFAGKSVTGKVALAATAASLLAGPIQRKLSEGTKGRTTYDNLNAIAERSKKDGTVYTRSGDKPMQNASYGRAIPGAGGATIASIPKANATPRKETQKLRGPVKRTSATGPTMDYKVETGDTLSAIAKRSGITLSELMALNKKIKDPRKIYRNTNVKIPSPGKVPDPMYTGPVPYRPGSKAAKEYEALRASRKK
jgi:LysM repeat protein